MKRVLLVVVGVIAALVVVDRALAAGGKTPLFQIFFNAGTANAVDRTAYDKMKDIISVKDYGAKGTGIDNDEVAVQQAITNAGGAGSDQLIQFPCPGNYKTTSYGTLGCGMYYPPFAATGAVPRAVSAKLLDIINIRDFAADPTNTTDSTAAIQAAINWASQGSTRLILVPAGTYKITGQLYTYYDASLNPGFSNTRLGTITLQGDGIASETGGTGGSIFNFTATTGNDLTLGTLTSNSRDVIIRNMTLQGATSGFVVDAVGQSLKVIDAEIVQSHASGSGIHVGNAWFGALENVRIRHTSSSSGDAIQLTTNTPAGLFTISRDSNVSGFAYGLRLTSVGWQSLSVTSSEIAASTVPIFLDTGSTLDLLTLSDAYFEGTCTSFIKDTDSNALKNLVINGMWAVSYNLSGPAIDLTAPNSVTINGVNAQDQYTAFLNIAALPSGGKAGYRVDGISFPRSHGNAAAPFKLFTGVIPLLGGVDYATADANTALYDTAGTATQMRIDPSRGLLTYTLDNLTLAYDSNDPTISIGFNDTRKWSFYLNHVNNAIGLYDWANSKMQFSLTTGGIVTLIGSTFANLGTPNNGSYTYCSDCDPASSPCTSAGAKTGSFAFRLNGAWKCI